mgnify:CR=1 FL=1
MTNIDLLYTGLERLPDVGEELYSEDFSLQLGGGLPGMLIHLSRLGVPVKLATALGDDLFSAFAREEYRKNGINPENFDNGSGFPVNVTSAMVLPHDRSFVTYGNGMMEADDDAKERFYTMAHGAKITLMQPDGYLEVYRKLHDEGTLLLLDTSWDDELSIEKYREYLTVADYYTPNRKEALRLTGAATVDDAAEQLQAFFEKPVIKLDKDGCLGIENGKKTVVPPLDVTAVDTTGAGDAFLAGFAYGLFEGEPFERCLLYGNITGGSCVTKVGALSAVITKEELHRIAKGGAYE